MTEQREGIDLASETGAEGGIRTHTPLREADFRSDTDRATTSFYVQNSVMLSVPRQSICSCRAILGHLVTCKMVDS